MSDDYELGLETLLAVRDELGVDLDDDFLKSCFEIQKKHQFNHERTLSMQAMDRLIEDRVEKADSTSMSDGV